jgi:hypothetical protein
MRQEETDVANKTFVLGAGFSASAQFPLVRNLKEQVIQLAQHLPYEVFFQPGNGGFENGQFYAGLEKVDSANSLQFEEVLIALLEHLRRADEADPCHVTLKVLRNVCSHLLWGIQDSIQEVQPCYKNFADWINVYGRTKMKPAIVSFNWDILAEKALTDSDCGLELFEF